MRGRSIDPYSYPHPNVVMVPIVIPQADQNLYISNIDPTAVSVGATIPLNGGVSRIACNGNPASVAVTIAPTASGTDPSMKFQVRGVNQFDEPISEELVYTGGGTYLTYAVYKYVDEIECTEITVIGDDTALFEFGTAINSAGCRYALPFRVRDTAHREADGGAKRDSQVWTAVLGSSGATVDFNLDPENDCLIWAESLAAGLYFVRAHIPPGRDF